MKTIEQRFREKVRIDESGCHIWTGAISTTGYGSFNAGGTRKTGFKYMGAHRFSYELANGKISENMYLDHLCRVRACVNPDHLEMVTPQVNAIRRIDVPRVTGFFKCGHPFSEENTYSNSKKRKATRCSTCCSEKDKQKRRAKGLKRVPNKMREQIYARSGGFCERCGAHMLPVSMVIHHRRLKKHGGLDEMSNLIGITASCHNLSTNSIHLNPEKSYENGYLVSAYADPKETPFLKHGSTWVYLDDLGNYIPSA